MRIEYFDKTWKKTKASFENIKIIYSEKDSHYQILFHNNTWTEYETAKNQTVTLKGLTLQAVNNKGLANSQQGIGTTLSSNYSDNYFTPSNNIASEDKPIYLSIDIPTKHKFKFFFQVMREYYNFNLKVKDIVDDYGLHALFTVRLHDFDYRYKNNISEFHPVFNMQDFYLYDMKIKVEEFELFIHSYKEYSISLTPDIRIIFDSEYAFHNARHRMLNEYIQAFKRENNGDFPEWNKNANSLQYTAPFFIP